MTAAEEGLGEDAAHEAAAGARGHDGDAHHGVGLAPASIEATANQQHAAELEHQERMYWTMPMSRLETVRMPVRQNRPDVRLQGDAASG